MTQKRYLIIYSIVLVGFLLMASMSQPERALPPPQPTATATVPARHSAVSLPPDFPAGFVHYATVDRKDGTIRDLMISQDALDSMRTIGATRVADGAILVIDQYSAARDENGDYLRDENGRFIKGERFDRFHVMEKRDNWSDADFVSAARSGNWNFASFDASTLQHTDEGINDCFNCHNTAIRTEFVWTRTELQRFVFTDEVQYVFCDQTGRTPCLPDQENPRN